MKNSIIIFFLTIFIFSCEKQLTQDYENMEFSCTEEISQILLEGEFDGKYFCYNKLSGYEMKYTTSATIFTEGNKLVSNIDSLDGKVVYYNNWMVMKDIRFDSIYDHYIYISSPSFFNIDSLKNFIPSILEEKHLNIHSSEISRKFAITLKYNYNGDSGYREMSSLYGMQDSNNFLRISNFEEKTLITGQTKYNFDFEFNCKLYHSINKHEYFGQISNGILKVSFVL